jgi:hypothetical protein
LQIGREAKLAAPWQKSLGMCPAIQTEPAPRVASRVAAGVASGLGANSLSRAAAFPEFIAIAIVARARSKSEAIERA